MSKKRKSYKNIKLEQQELEATTIGVFENRKKSSIGIVVIMTIFILAVFFLPEISNLADKYLNPVTPITPNPNPSPSTPTTPDPNEPDDDDYGNTFYNLGSELVITRDDITINGITLDSTNNTLNFKVINNTNSSLVIGNLNYYLELYNSEQTLIGRLKITGLESVANNYPITYKKSISESIANSLISVTLIKRDVNEYPAVTLNTNEEGNGSLICTNENETVTYKFHENALKEVSNELRRLSIEDTYYVDYNDNKIASNNYNTKTGITSSFIEYTEGYTITTTVNLNESNRLYIYSADTFNLNTEPQVVKFELEAQGFKCN